MDKELLKKLPLVSRAKVFAAEAHKGQLRKYTGEAYFYHVNNVALAVFAAKGSETMVAAAYLHDVVEDTKYTIEDIGELFGLEVAELVYDLTDHFTSKNYPNWNRAKRKYHEAKRLGKVSKDAKLIKWCDLADNTSTIVKYDPGFAKIYLKEKAYTLEEMGY